MFRNLFAGLGVLFALIWIVAPLWTTLLAIPAAVIARALRYIRQLEGETRSAVATDAGLLGESFPVGPTLYWATRLLRSVT